MKINIFLDDLRIPYENFIVARNYNECIKLLNEYEVECISLDHDLGKSKSGYDVAMFIIKNKIYIKKIYIHSANPVGAQNIYQLLDRYCQLDVEIKIIPYINKIFTINKYFKNK